MKPLIGINLDVKPEADKTAPHVGLQIKYYESVQKSGGIPVLLPPMPRDDLNRVLKNLDGVMLIGGPDYSAGSYGEEQSDLVDPVHPIREEFDFLLMDLLLKHTALPILGICAGHQLLNIYMGGSLIQDIPKSLPHSDVVHGGPDGWKAGRMHGVIIQPDSMLANIYKIDKIDVPTSHHQAVKKLGRDLKVTAVADDGIVEAVELAERPFTVGVQWHPERDYPGNEVLFLEFMRHARAG